MIDLDRYLERIGLSGPASPAALHRAHATSIPFENLDPWAGRPVSLELEDIQAKLVVARQGGYCFEHNLLFKAVLEQLGYTVELLLGRARTGAWPGEIRPRTHAMLRVWIDDRPWLADVGFGFGGLLEPLALDGSGALEPSEPSDPVEQAGWRFRLRWDGPELVLQTARDQEWGDQYGVVPEPVPLIDAVTANWMTCTYPSSPFVRGPMISATAPDGTRRLVRGDGLEAASFIFVEQTPTRRDTAPVAPEQLPALLERRFGLDPGRLPGLAPAVPASRPRRP